MGYDPKNAGMVSFQAVRPAFVDGTDSPRAFLERCIAAIEARESELQAFVALNFEGARKAADASSERYRAGRPASDIDGLPIAIKDVHDTEDMPMEAGSPVLRGNRTGWDGAAVHALRKGGAAIIGKTVTTEFAFARPGPARNPWDAARTPGGSSSGSGAAVGAGMVPVATGTQVRGSVLRPAAYCGAFVVKASYGAINTLGGFPSAPSLVHLSFLAGTLADSWTTSHWVSHAAGGDPGHPSLAGPRGLPPAEKPKRLARLDTAGWSATEAPVKTAFETYLATLTDQRIEIADRRTDPEIEAVEKDLVELRTVIALLLTYEGRYPLAMYAERCPGLLSERVHGRAADFASITPEHYAEALEWCAAFRARYARLAERFDGCITLNQVDPAPVGMPVGDVVYGEPSSVLGVPALNLPLLAIDGMPLGIQPLGFYRQDHRLVALGRWLSESALG